jgi:hypothetical protein
MSIEKILLDLSHNPVMILKEDELKSFLSQVEVIREENTYLCDYIRIAKYSNEILVQEKSDKNEIVIRKMNSLEEAENFVQERLAYYDRKWDGCGCKVDYYS